MDDDLAECGQDGLAKCGQDGLGDDIALCDGTTHPHHGCCLLPSTNGPITNANDVLSQDHPSPLLHEPSSPDPQLSLTSAHPSSSSSSSFFSSCDTAGRSWLLRLFESPFCDVSMTLSYFFNASQEGIALYLGNKLFTYCASDVSWYLLQLVHMYLHVESTQTILFRYLNQVSAIDLKFSLRTTWLLEAYLLGVTPPSLAQLSLIRKLLNSILLSWCRVTTPPLIHLEYLPDVVSSFPGSISPPCDHLTGDACTPSSHHPQSHDSTCISFFISERSFVTELVLIGRRLESITSKSSRLNRLHSELLTLDRTLSHAVFIPITSVPDHVVVRIPYKDSSILNSKDKAPYLVYIEVIEKASALKNYSNLMELKQAEYKNYVNSLERRGQLDPSVALPHFSVSSPQMPAIYEAGHCLYHTQRSSSGPDESEESVTAITTEPPVPLSVEDTNSDSQKPVSVRHIRDSLKSFRDSTQNAPAIKNANDPSAIVVLEPWKNKVERIRDISPFGHIDGWNLYSLIVKCGDDLRQDYLAYQFLKTCMDIWHNEHVPLWVRPYGVVITESQAGLIEAVTDSVSIHQIKNRTGVSLEEYFRTEYGAGSDQYSEAKKNFIQSLAGYSLFQYIFQVKDRHNGNILLHFDGHIIHVDFGYILGQSPKSISFETSPFKMTSDFMELLEGPTSDFFLYFKSLLLHGFLALRKHMGQLMVLVEILRLGNQMPCLGKGGQAIDALKRRFHNDMNDVQISNLINKLVDQSINSITTVLYDKFQYYTNGIIA